MANAVTNVSPYSRCIHPLKHVPSAPSTGNPRLRGWANSVFQVSRSAPRKGKHRGSPVSAISLGRRNNIVQALLLAVLATGLTLGLAGWGDLYNETDGQYAAAARVMAEGGSWLTPENNGVPRINKPPLLYWWMTPWFVAGGVNEFAARAPSVLGIVAWVMGVFFLGRAWRDARTGFWAGAILLTCLGTSTLGRIIMPEPWFCAFITWAVVAVWFGLRPEARTSRWALVFWICCALAAMVKGWHGFVLPGMILVFGGLWAGRRDQVWRMVFFPPGWAIAAAISLPWLLLMEWKFPGFLRYFFLDEALGHVAGSDGTDTSYDNVPQLPFFLLHAAWFFPWSLAVLGGFARWRDWRWPVAEERVLWVWGLLVILILLVAGQRQDYYGMMGWPLFALFGAWAVTQAQWKGSAWLLAAMGATGLFASWMFPWWSRWLPAQTATMAERATALSTVAGFDAGVWISLRDWAIIVFISFLLLGLLIVWFLRFNRTALATSAWLLAAMVLAVASSAGVARISPWFSHANAARWILENQPDAVVAFDGASDTGSSLYFYLGRPVFLVQENAQPEFAARVHGVGREWTMEPDELVARWDSGEPVLLITEALEVPTWRIRYPQLEEVQRFAEQVLLLPASINF
jgi:4-amino-4-deoxy-L-arabinose transferase-like glycosyltransferase